jgi:hypothetical protein
MLYPAELRDPVQTYHATSYANVAHGSNAESIGSGHEKTHRPRWVGVCEQQRSRITLATATRFRTRCALYQQAVHLWATPANSVSTQVNRGAVEDD